jgi:hypothetical protein
MVKAGAIAAADVPPMRNRDQAAAVWSAMLAAAPALSASPAPAGDLFTATFYGLLFEMFREGPVDVAFAGNPREIESLRERVFAVLDAYEETLPAPPGVGG